MEYIKGRKNSGLTFHPTSDFSIFAYSDASYAACSTTRKSTTGKAVFINNNLLTFGSKKQSIVAMSSCESEMIAIQDTAADVMELRHILDELTGKKPPPSIIYTDSQSAMSLIKNGRPSGRSRARHIDLRQFKIREWIREGFIELLYVPSNENIADLFTKPLPAAQFQRLRDRLLSSNPHLEISSQLSEITTCAGGC